MNVDNEREIPGATPVKWREYRYVLDDGRDSFIGNGLFNKLTGQIAPLIPTSGGAITENCKLLLPSGECLQALSYKGDIEGWRKQIEKGAKELGLFTGKIMGDEIILSDNRRYKLSACKVEFY
ncbi:hypothetical protein B0C58_004729 [Salmonella enterica subsp. enterica serovar Oranienburg]|nr:hypothetical protein [Salmonella enterica subsp. enterica serovar Oranienburg]